MTTAMYSSYGATFHYHAMCKYYLYLLVLTCSELARLLLTTYYYVITNDITIHTDCALSTRSWRSHKFSISDDSALETDGNRQTYRRIYGRQCVIFQNARRVLYELMYVRQGVV